MDDKVYKYVYRMLLFDIYNGSFCAQNKMPSIAQLSQKYNAGKNSVKLALQALEKDGYIEIKNGSNAKILFTFDDFQNNTKYIQTLVNSKAMIQEIFKTMKLILPDIAIVCLENANEDQIHEWGDMIQNFEIEGIQSEGELLRKLYEIYLYILSFLGNPLLSELFFTLLNSVYSPLQNGEEQYKEMKKAIKIIKYLLNFIYHCALRKNYRILKNVIAFMCNAFCDTSIKYIDTLRGDINESEKTQFLWVRDRTHKYLYVQVITDIIRKIELKEYKIGSFLPSIAKLCEEYEVSEKTVRKALAILSALKAIETVNGKGSIVKIEKYQLRRESIFDESIEVGLQDFYYGLQLFNLILPSIGIHQLKNVSRIERKVISKKERNVFIESLYDEVLKSDNACLCNIYSSLLMNHGFMIFVDLEFEDYQYKIEMMYDRIKTEFQAEEDNKVLVSLIELNSLVLEVLEKNYIYKR